MQSTSTTLLAAALGLATSPTSAVAQAKVGAWIAGSNGPEHVVQCMAFTSGEQPQEAFAAIIDDLGEIKFTFVSPHLSLSEGDSVTAMLVVDGMPIALGETWVLNDRIAGLTGTVKGRLDGSILRAVEEGKRADVEVGNVRASFGLEGATEAMILLTQCDENDGVMPVPAEVSDGGESDGEVVGSWLIAPSPSELGGGGCYVARLGPQETMFSIHQKRSEDAVRFAVRSKDFELIHRWVHDAELSVDGEEIVWHITHVADPQTLTSDEVHDSADFVQRLRNGTTAEFRFEHHHLRFNLHGFDAAIPKFADCVAEHGAMSSLPLFGLAVSGNPALGITDDAQSAVVPDWREAADSEEPEIGDDFDPDAVAALLNSEPARAELQCFVESSSIFGILGTATQSPPIELIVAIEEDGGVRTNGTRIDPLHVQLSEDGVTPAHSVFRAQDVFSAAMRTEIGDMFAQALTGDPSDKGAMGLGTLLGSPASMIPEDRLVSFSLVNDDVTILGNLSNGQLGHLASAPCLRFR